jgi:PAS domain S-box-containing protein
MPAKLKVLILEDRAADAELALHELRRAGYDPDWKRVETEPDFLAQLDRSWDIILVDYSLPEFDGLRALDIMWERGLDIPVIIVSGAIGEEKAVAAMKAGANDYIMKDRLARLGPAVERELRDAVERQGRKRAEEALRESEARYRVLFEGTEQGILVADAQTQRLKYANLSISRMLGYTPEELLRLGVADIHPQESLPRVQSEFEAQIRKEKTLAAGLPCLRKDGTVFYADVNSSPILIDGRQCNVAFFTDITEIKRAEEARRQAEENFRRSMDESPLGIRIVGAKGETLYANRAILDIYGYDDIEELKSTPVKNRYAPESYAEYQIRKKKRMKGGDYPSEYEISIIRKTGEIRRLQAIRKEILWDDKKQFQTIYRDVTERKKAEEKIRETVGSLRNALGGIIQVLSSITEKRDPYTSGHQKRVADLARAIGQEMGLAAERVEGLRLAGTIHDVGKVSVPAEILSKPGPLTKIEFEMIKSHPQIGHDIVQDIDFSQPIAEMILQHHERMNGSGYPRRLKGEDLLLEARILAVSDVVEAMASHRPYRPALGIGAALEEIEKNKGVLYDQDVVTACLALFREKGFAFK